MINANELRIGNYINVYDGVGPKYMYQVTGYDIDEIDGDGTDCFPIPLTPEILEKCGFEKQSEHIFISPNLSLRLWGFSWTMQHYVMGVSHWIDISSVSIKHLHQLQNLYFALTNSELTFKL